MRATGCFAVAGSHRNMVKSSEPDTSRSGRPPHASLYRSSAACASVAEQRSAKLHQQPFCACETVVVQFGCVLSIASSHPQAAQGSK